VRCDGCGTEGWFKPVVCRDDRDRRGVLCDGCYEPLGHRLWVVPGFATVTARCDECERFVNPGEIVPSTLRPAGWKEAFGGLCRSCAT
jgi:hypothetical protein